MWALQFLLAYNSQSARPQRVLEESVVVGSSIDALECPSFAPSAWFCLCSLLALASVPLCVLLPFFFFSLSLSLSENPSAGHE